MARLPCHMAKAFPGRNRICDTALPSAIKRVWHHFYDTARRISDHGRHAFVFVWGLLLESELGLLLGLFTISNVFRLLKDGVRAGWVGWVERAQQWIWSLLLLARECE